MKFTKYNLGLAVVSALAVSALAVGSVSAISGSGSGGDGTSGSGSSHTTTAVKPVTTSEVRTVSSETSGGTGASAEPELNAEQAAEIEHGTKQAMAKVKVDELKLRADKLLATERRAKKTETKVADRQKACQARETNLNNKIANYNKHAKKQLAAYDATFAKLQAFQADKKLTVPTYDALVATANTQKAAATAAVDALAAVSVKIDCTSTDPAASVATVRAAVKNARVALQAYRTSVKDVLVALMTAKHAASTTTTPETTSTKETNQ